MLGLKYLEIEQQDLSLKCSAWKEFQLQALRDRVKYGELGHGGGDEIQNKAKLSSLGFTLFIGFIIQTFLFSVQY